MGLIADLDTVLTRLSGCWQHIKDIRTGGLGACLWPLWVTEHLGQREHMLYCSYFNCKFCKIESFRFACSGTMVAVLSCHHCHFRERKSFICFVWCEAWKVTAQSVSLFIFSVYALVNAESASFWHNFYYPVLLTQPLPHKEGETD